MAELRPSHSPAWEARRRGPQLGDQRSELVLHEDLLHGTRGIRRPLVAVTTRKELGPARHALAQMVVAGTMVVHPPLRAGQKAGTPEPAGPRVLTFTPPPPREEPAPPAPPPPRPPPPRPAPRPAAPQASGWKRVDGASETRSSTMPDGRTLTQERRTLMDFASLHSGDD